jgi:hypothetical protein
VYGLPLLIINIGIIIKLIETKKRKNTLMGGKVEIISFFLKFSTFFLKFFISKFQRMAEHHHHKALIQ